MFIVEGGASFGRLEFPDPCSAIWLHDNLDEKSVGVRWIKQRRMRAQVFGHARQEFASRGCEGIQLRSIARDCSISVQTIYNLVGDRSQVIRQSADEWVCALARAASRRALAQDVSELIALLGIFWCAPLRSQHFVSNATRAAINREVGLNSVFNDAGCRYVGDVLKSLANTNQLRSSVYIPALARQMVSTVQMGIYEWTRSPYDIADYWREFQNGPALMVQAVALGAEVSRVETSLQIICSASGDNLTRH